MMGHLALVGRAPNFYDYGENSLTEGSYKKALNTQIRQGETEL